jgi:predicted alpha/beta superfamily hydrolase
MRKLFLNLFTFCSWVTAHSQTAPVHYDTIYSEVLKEKRALQIYLPKNYQPGSADKFDAVYVLDGEWNTSLTSTVYNFLAYAKFVPQNIIIVGINNPSNDNVNLRDRDFTPTHTEYGPVSGGADKFLACIKEELMPYIQKTYPVKKEGSTLYGTSLGGLFALYAFLMEPQLFKSYLTVEPSLWWDKQYLTALAAKKLDDLNGLNNTVWIASRDGKAFQQMGVKAIDSVFRESAPPGLVWKTVGYADETHFSAIWKGIYDGLKFSYTGHLKEGSILINPMNGIVLKDKPFRLACYNSSADSIMRYTIDGTPPTPASSRLKSENLLAFSGSKTLTVRSFSPREEFNFERKGHFEVGSTLPPLVKPKGVKAGGLRYEYYEGDWDVVPNIKKVKPQRSGLAGNGFDLNNFSKSTNFACILNGFLEITEPGYYTFELESHDKTKVYLSDQLIIGNNNVPNFGERFIVPLDKGFYPLRIEYFYKKGGQPLKPVYIMPDGKNDYQIPLEVLYSR